ncbi:MAG: C40 family peptidase [Sediminibacterium sp.]
MSFRSYIILLGMGLSCSSCHLLQPVFSKSAPAPAVKPTVTASAPLAKAVTPGSKGTAAPIRTVKAAPASGTPASAFKNESVNPTGLRPAENLYVLQESPAFLQVKYGILLDVVAEKLTNPSLLQVMDTWWGTRYCLGGSTDNCIDCSAFVQVLYRDVYQTPLPRTANEQYAASELIEKDELKEGDLVFFHTRGRKNAITHVGVYLQNNKFLHASTSNGVSISDLDESYWKPRFRGGGRLKSQI